MLQGCSSPLAIGTTRKLSSWDFTVLAGSDVDEQAVKTKSETAAQAVNKREVTAVTSASPENSYLSCRDLLRG
jgi:hypothetical protein